MRGLVFDNTLSFRDGLPEPLKGTEDGEALVRVSLAGICATDLAITAGYMGYSGILGHEFVGVVEQASDPDLTGKRVVGEINAACGVCDVCLGGRPRHCPERTVLGILGRSGAFCDRLTLPADNLHVLPDAIPDEAAVFVEPLAAAFRILEQVDIGPDDTVCVMGDGRLGLLIAQVVATTGCALTLLGKHKEKRALAEGWGIPSAPADADLPPADVVIDATGAPTGIADAVARVRPCGTVVLKSTCADAPTWNPAPLVINEITVVGSRCGPFAPAIRALADGEIDVIPLISATYRLEEGVAAFEKARAPGILKVLLDPAAR